MTPQTTGPADLIAEHLHPDRGRAVRLLTGADVACPEYLIASDRGELAGYRAALAEARDLIGAEVRRLEQERALAGGTGGTVAGSPAPTGDAAIDPDHYRAFPVEVIEVTEQLAFNPGNAVKYLARAGRKPGADEIEDLLKAGWYAARESRRVAPARA